jgi:cytochrome c oxidase cbb3-type subunit III
MWFNMDDSINVLSLLGAAVIVVLTIVVAGKYIRQMKDDSATGDLMPDRWDGIGEYTNDVPKGWAIAWILCMLWGLWYWFVGYPLNAYSQIGEWNEEVRTYQNKFEATWKDADKETLIAMGESIFLVQCAPCHGETAEGMNGKAQNLVTWGKEAWVAHFALHGTGMDEVGKMRMSARIEGYPMMPAGMIASQEDAKKVAAYIVDVFTPATTQYPELIQDGKSIYEMACAACHGMDGNGMMNVAPGLHNVMYAVLDKGLKGNIGKMPAFRNRFTDIQKKALNEYVFSLQ